MRSSILLISAALALGTVSVAAAAQEVVATRTPAPSATVSMAGLNLASRTGIAAAKSRIEATAADLCLTSAVEPLDVRLARSKCYRAAVSDGYRQLNRMAAAEGARSLAASAALTLTAS